MADNEECGLRNLLSVDTNIVGCDKASRQSVCMMDGQATYTYVVVQPHHTVAGVT